MKIIVIGSKGMLGYDLMQELANTQYDAIGVDIEDIDITNQHSMEKIVSLRPDIIINCAAYTDVDEAEKEKEKAHKINVEGINNLTKICKKDNITLIHISTDYVFNGEKKEYNEDDAKDPINYYGKTKSDGEDIIINNLRHFYLIRTSWLFGKNGKNFVETIKKLLDEKKEIKVVNDQIGRPTYTKDLAKEILSFIDSSITNQKKPYGIYHITNSGKCTWYEFALEIKDQRKKKFNKNKINNKCKILACRTEEFQRPAKRPRYSLLNNNKTQHLRSWKKALEIYMEK